MNCRNSKEDISIKRSFAIHYLKGNLFPIKTNDPWILVFGLRRITYYLTDKSEGKV